MPNFKIIGLLVLEKKIFKVFAINNNGGHLGHVTRTIYTTFVPSYQIGQAVSEKKIFEYYGNIHIYMYCPRAKAVHLPISFKFFSSNDSLTTFSIQMHGRAKLTLP